MKIEIVGGELGRVCHEDIDVGQVFSLDCESSSLRMKTDCGYVELDTGDYRAHTHLSTKCRYHLREAKLIVEAL